MSEEKKRLNWNNISLFLTVEELTELRDKCNDLIYRKGEVGSNAIQDELIKEDLKEEKSSRTVYSIPSCGGVYSLGQVMTSSGCFDIGGLDTWRGEYKPPKEKKREKIIEKWKNDRRYKRKGAW